MPTPTLTSAPSRQIGAVHTLDASLDKAANSFHVDSSTAAFSVEARPGRPGVDPSSRRPRSGRGATWRRHRGLRRTGRPAPALGLQPRRCAPLHRGHLRHAADRQARPPRGSHLEEPEGSRSGRGGHGQADYVWGCDVRTTPALPWVGRGGGSDRLPRLAAGHGRRWRVLARPRRPPAADLPEVAGPSPQTRNVTESSRAGWSGSAVSTGRALHRWWSSRLRPPRPAWSRSCG